MSGGLLSTPLPKVADHAKGSAPLRLMLRGLGEVQPWVDALAFIAAGIGILAKHASAAFKELSTLARTGIDTTSETNG